MGEQEKKAMSEAERNKIIKAMILASVTSAGIGALARSAKSKKDRKKKMQTEMSSNAIVVPISKKDFMRDLPTPDEQKGLTTVLDKTTNEPVPLPAVEDAPALAPADLAAQKKAILRGRKFDFFGRNLAKAAEEKKTEEPASAGKKHPEGKLILRGEDGRFASPTDPVGVADAGNGEGNAEKTAGFWDWMTDLAGSVATPFDSAKEIWNTATGKPLWIAGGAIGSVYLAEKISDAINQRRREKSKKRLDAARDKYVSLMAEGAEKAAENKVNEGLGMLWGGSFFIPAALTAMITLRVNENRKAEKKKRKEMSNSYPDTPSILYRTIDDTEKIAEADRLPTFLYKTAEGQALEIGADTLLATILVKRAMFLAAERAEQAQALEKEAQFVPGGIGVDVMKEKQKGPKFSDEDIDRAVDYATKVLLKDRNRGALLDLIKNYQEAKDLSSLSDRFVKMMPDKEKIQAAFKAGPAGDLEEIAQDPRFMARLAQSQKLQDQMVQNFGSDKDYIDYKNKMIADNIGDWLAKKGLNKGGFLHKIISWLAQNTGIGGYLFNNRLRDTFGGIGSKAQGEIDRQKAEAAKKEQYERDTANAARVEGGAGQEEPIGDGGEEPISTEPPPSYGGMGYLPDNMREGIGNYLANPNGAVGQAVGKAPVPSSGQAKPGPSPTNAAVDAQNYSGSEAPDFATSEPATITWHDANLAAAEDKRRLAEQGPAPSAGNAIRFTGASTRIPSPQDASWQTLSRLQEQDPALKRQVANEVFNQPVSEKSSPAPVWKDFSKPMAEDAARLAREQQMQKALNMNDQQQRDMIDKTVSQP